LLRVAEHIRTQNWTAIAIDFAIVVIGVFVGIQVKTDWVRRTGRTGTATDFGTDWDSHSFRRDGLGQPLISTTSRMDVQTSKGSRL
jgi:hypothetical protein